MNKPLVEPDAMKIFGIAGYSGFLLFRHGLF
jgi:hypothetical protein